MTDGVTSSGIPYNTLFEDFPRVLEVDPDLEVREELLSFHAMNGSVAENSSSRMFMYSAHVAQMLAIIHGETSIWQSGLESQFSKNTFSCKAKNDCTVLRVVSRYNGNSSDYAKGLTEVVVFVVDNETGEIDFIKVPYYHTLHQYFGFKYMWNKGIVNDLTKGLRLKKGTVLADSPTVGPNDTYNYGVNANIALMRLPETAEDGVIISESLSNKLVYKIFERRVINCGAEKIPLNIYGDENEYKAFPEIGQKVNTDSVLMAVRTYDEALAPALFTKKALMEYDPQFDEPFYVKGPGKDEVINGFEVTSGTVVDVISYFNPKFKKSMFTGVADDATKYINGYKKYHEDIIGAYEDIKKEYRSVYGDNNLKLSERLHRQIINSYAIANPDGNKIGYCFRKDNLDIIRIEIVVEYTVRAKVGSKISDMAGSKGVIVQVKPDHEMPVDIYGEKAQILMDPSAVVSRMNMGRLYGVYFNASSRHTKSLITNWLYAEKTNFPTSNLDAIPITKDIVLKPLNQYSDAVINTAFDIAVGFTAVFGTEQFEGYRAITDRASKENILKDIVTKELFFYYRAGSKRKRYQVAYGIESAIYKPIRDRVKFIMYGKEYISKKPIRIAPQYTILLGKTADNFLSTASAKTNHFGLGVGIPSHQRHRNPFKDTAVKNESETEGRLFVSFAPPQFVAEINDRANKDINRYIYGKLLRTPKPTNVGQLIDRSVIPYGNNSALQVIESVFNCAGVGISYVRDSAVIHENKEGV